MKMLPPARTATELRNTAGIATIRRRDLLPVVKQAGTWLRGDDVLARIPLHVAEQMNLLSFSTFDALRKDFWRRVAADPLLQEIYQDASRRQRAMREGVAPLAPESQQIVKLTRETSDRVKAELPGADADTVGGVILESEVDPDSLKSYQLHHQHPIHAGGGVYDLSNLVVVTPLVHTALLNPDFHYEMPGWLRRKIAEQQAKK